jgi:hypothetical protein
MEMEVLHLLIQTLVLVNGGKSSLIIDIGLIELGFSTEKIAVEIDLEGPKCLLMVNSAARFKMEPKMVNGTL